MSYEKVYDLQRMYDTVNHAANYLRDKNSEGSATRSRHLSLAITDMESAENWISRALAEAEGESNEEPSR